VLRIRLPLVLSASMALVAGGGRLQSPWLSAVAVACALFAAALVVFPGAARASVEIKAPALTTAFDQASRDYAIRSRRCDGFRLRVRTPGRTSARIGDGRFFGGSRAKRIRLGTAEAVTVTAKARRHGKTMRRHYRIRCLPDGFPRYEFDRGRRPVATRLFSVTPLSLALGDGWVIIFNDWGAPVWWKRTDVPALDGKVLPGGDVAYATLYGIPGYGNDERNAYVIVSPDGRRVRRVKVDGSLTDNHDLQQTADGNYVVVSYRERPQPVDATAYNGDAAAHVIDAYVQVQDPVGNVVWDWNSKDHIDLAETGRWWAHLDNEPYDIVHLNSVDLLANGDILVSFRHLDAVYRIDGDTGEIKWKLGGTETPQRLAVRGDDHPDLPLGGQHDARRNADGTVSVHDNGTFLDRSPRVVSYRIEDGKAAIVDEIRDPHAAASMCCGSARSVGDSWLISWGGLPTVTEFNSADERTFELTMPGYFSYRAIPAGGRVSPKRLRAGMDRQAARLR
jgi:hypothetical protein